MTEIQPKIPIDYNSLRDAVRKGLTNSASRYYWWPNLPNVSSSGAIETSADIGLISERLTALLSEETINESMQESVKGKERSLIISTADSIMQVLTRTKIIRPDEIPIFETILRMVVATIRRADVCCMLAGDLLANRDKYIDPDATAYAALLSDFRDTLNTFSPKTYATLFGIGALEDRFLDLIFRDFFIELLPPDVVMRVIDAFLLEGNRILFRYGMAIVRAYKTQIKAETYMTATSFWHAVKADAINAATKANAVMLFKTIGREERLPIVDPFVIFSKAKNPAFLETNLINEYPFDEDRSLLSKMMRPMALTNRRASFTAPNFASPLSALNSNSAGVPAGSQKATRKASISGLTARPSVTDMFLNATPGQATDSANSSPVPPVHAVLARRGSASAASFKDMSTKVRAASADVTTNSEMSTSPVPSRPQETVFTASAFTSPAGNDNSDASRPTPGSALSPVPGGAVTTQGVLLDAEQAAGAMSFSSSILTASTAVQLLDAVPHAIPLGGYHLCFSTAQQGYNLGSLYTAVGTCAPVLLLVQLAAPLEHITLGAFLSGPLQPGDKFRGNAQTACFRLDRDGVQYHRWVGSQKDGESGAVEAARVQFMRASHDVLTFGASDEHGTNALRLDDALQRVFTGPTDTFGNPALVHPSESADGVKAGGGFAIKEVEVFCALPTSSRGVAGGNKTAASKVFADISDM